MSKWKERIIPACAGRSRRQGWRKRTAGDHPRVCGEKVFLRLLRCGLAGSSPRVRGEVLGFFFGPVGLRIIPACAGRSWSARPSRRPRWDHPRVCGEKMSGASATWMLSGSSPRVRGEVGLGSRAEVLDRIIPACAGRSSRRDPASVRHWDHPRVCGEKVPTGPRPTFWVGSSPRVRGEAALVRPLGAV